MHFPSLIFDYKSKLDVVDFIPSFKQSDKKVVHYTKNINTLFVCLFFVIETTSLWTQDQTRSYSIDILDVVYCTGSLVDNRRV